MTARAAPGPVNVKIRLGAARDSGEMFVTWRDSRAFKITCEQEMLYTVELLFFCFSHCLVHPTPPVVPYCLSI